jgi:hypothetical protein
MKERVLQRIPVLDARRRPIGISARAMRCKTCELIESVVSEPFTAGGTRRTDAYEAPIGVEERSELGGGAPSRLFRRSAVPRRTPLSVSAFLTHSLSDCAVQPIFAAIEVTVAHREE